MKRQVVLKIVVDVIMTVLLMLLMAFELIGRTAHEWLGTVMFVMFVVHHVLNRKWTGHLLKGKYTPSRIFQTVIVVLVLLCILFSVISGIVLSRYVFDFLSIGGGRSWARILHMVGAYWGFVFMSLHLGLHWNMMMGMAGKAAGQPSPVRSRILKTAGILIACYGIYAFIKRGIGSYMLLRNMFVFFDFEEPLTLFYVDYIAVMGLFVWIGHYLSKFLRALPGKKDAGAGDIFQKK
nr:DUF4405 domain-containing protein [uncultured Mediterraneibacter sp.]